MTDADPVETREWLDALDALAREDSIPAGVVAEAIGRYGVYTAHLASWEA